MQYLTFWSRRSRSPFVVDFIRFSFAFSVWANRLCSLPHTIRFKKDYICTGRIKLLSVCQTATAKKRTKQTDQSQILLCECRANDRIGIDSTTLRTSRRLQVIAVKLKQNRLPNKRNIVCSISGRCWSYRSFVDRRNEYDCKSNCMSNCWFWLFRQILPKEDEIECGDRFHIGWLKSKFVPVRPFSFQRNRSTINSTWRDNVAVATFPINFQLKWSQKWDDSIHLRWRRASSANLIWLKSCRLPTINHLLGFVCFSFCHLFCFGDEMPIVHHRTAHSSISMRNCNRSPRRWSEQDESKKREIKQKETETKLRTN